MIFLIERAMPDLGHHRTDIVMPEMDGHDICRHIGSDERMHGLPVILVTTLSDSTDVIRGLEVGANSFILHKM